MLAAHLTSAQDNNLAVITPDGAVTWRELVDQIDELTEQFRPFEDQRIGVCLPANAAGIAGLAALDRLAAHAYLIDELASAAHVEDWADRFQWQAVARFEGGMWTVTSCKEPGDDRKARFEVGRSLVTILTSGTEGAPKAATYTWEQLSKPVRVAAQATDNVWLLTFRIHLYAGLQVFLQAMLNHQTIVIPQLSSDPLAIIQLMAESKVTNVSATPSYWRRLMLFGDRGLLASAPLRQITLGGELSDQPLLDSLKAVFPHARLTHIYATTELGRCFAVTDGQAGFPRAFLEIDNDANRPTNVDAQLSVIDGQLYIKPVFGSDSIELTTAQEASESSEDGWFATGDLVEVTEDRVLFAGRAGDMINVGGNKVRPAVVESTIRGVPGVADVRVFAKSSSIAGQLVACDLVVADDAIADELKRLVQATCRASLQPYQCPRLINIVEEIEVSDTGKTKRI